MRGHQVSSPFRTQSGYSTPIDTHKAEEEDEDGCYDAAQDKSPQHGGGLCQECAVREHRVKEWVAEAALQACTSCEGQGTGSWDSQAHRTWHCTTTVMSQADGQTSHSKPQSGAWWHMTGGHDLCQRTHSLPWLRSWPGRCFVSAEVRYWDVHSCLQTPLCCLLLVLAAMWPGLAAHCPWPEGMCSHEGQTDRASMRCASPAGGPRWGGPHRPSASTALQPATARRGPRMPAETRRCTLAASMLRPHCCRERSPWWLQHAYPQSAWLARGSHLCPRWANSYVLIWQEGRLMPVQLRSGALSLSAATWPGYSGNRQPVRHEEMRREQVIVATDATRTSIDWASAFIPHFTVDRTDIAGEAVASQAPLSLE